MDIKGSNTEPYYLFLRNLENLGSNIKLAYGALHALSEDGNLTFPSRIGGLIVLPTGGEPWGSSTKWKSVKRRIPLVRRFISQMGIVLVAAAFEDFLTNVTAEHSRYFDFARKEKLEKELLAGGDPLRNLYTSLGWNINPISYLLPLYDYFTVARNCIAHRSGRASDALVEKAGSVALANCIKDWPSRRRRTIPELPQPKEAQDIQFFPRHAILFSEVCQRAAININSLLLDFLGVEGTVYLAAHYGLLAEDRVRTNARRSPEQIINFILTDRFHVPIPDKYEVIGILKGIDLWDECRSTYAALYPETE
jgi:hypothetical protein